MENGGMKELHNELHRHYGLLLGMKSPWALGPLKCACDAY